jgi:tRNA(adenine34) deaminase
MTDIQNQKELDERYMREAIALAKQAGEIDEVPVGALIVCRGRIIAEAYNTRESDRSATSHAELRAIEAACRALGGWRLPDSTLYVTLEPCVMCAGAILHARLDRVVFGAYDPKAGAFGSVLDLNAYPLNHKTAVTGGVLAEECGALLSDYFRSKREKQKQKKEQRP